MTSIDEILQLAGVAAITIPGDMLRELRQTEGVEKELEARSLFTKHSTAEEQLDHQTYINDEQKYRTNFAMSDGGKGQAKTDLVKIYCPSLVRELAS